MASTLGFDPPFCDGLSCRPLGLAPCFDDRAEDQQGDDGNDLPAQDRTVHVDGRLPADLPLPDQKGTDRASREAEAASPSLALGVAAPSCAASHRCCGHEHDTVLLVGIAEDPFDGQGIPCLRDHVLYTHRTSPPRLWLREKCR